MKDCPFYAGSTIEDPRFFIGRRDLLKLLSDRMQSSQPTSINIVGRHKTGKSSLLIHFQQSYRQRVKNPELYKVIYLSLQDVACQTEQSFYGEIIKAVGAQQDSNPSRSAFNAWIRDLKEQGTTLVLCIDNFEELLERQDKFPNDFYDNLRFLIDRNCLMMVMASQEMLDLYSQTKKITSDFFNVFHTATINQGFSDLEAEELVSWKNSAGEGLTADMKKIALNWGQNEPFLLQLAGRTLWDMQQYGKSQKWAKLEFTRQANRFKPASNTAFTQFLFHKISDIGQLSVWTLNNKDELKNFWFGLFVIGVGLGVFLLFISGNIDLEQIRAIYQKK